MLIVSFALADVDGQCNVASPFFWSPVAWRGIFFDEDDWEIADERGAERLQEINFQTPREALYKGVILKETMYEVMWKSDRGRGFFFCRGQNLATLPWRSHFIPKS